MGFLLATSVASLPALAAKAPIEPTPPYAVIADVATLAQTVARIKVRSIAVVPAERAPGVPAGQARYFVEADSLSLIRGDDGLAKRISFLIDGPADRKARPVQKGWEYLAFGKGGARLDMVQLLSSRALILWSPDAEALTRKIVAEVVAPDAPPPITRINSAFHVAGTVAGESETQIFLDTQDKRPISLTIARRPDEQPQFGAALGEVVGDANALPPRDTLLWYRLACQMPAALPTSATVELPPADAEAAQKDYKDFQAALGECSRDKVAIGIPAR